MRLFRIVFLLLLLFVGESSVAQNTLLPKYEYRAVWLTAIENLDWPRSVALTPADVERQKNDLCVILDSLESLHINTVLLQTRVRGDVIYPSEIEPFSHVFTGSTGLSPGYDPLAFAIEECHKRGIALHAWLVTLPLGKVEHVRRQGRHSVVQRRRDLCTRFKGQWYMEPGNPATAGYIVALVDEILANYDVDGVHLDYVRYPDSSKGYPDASLHRKYGKGLTLADWRRRNVTEIARKVYACVKARKPWVRVSCASLGKHDDLARYSSLGWNARHTVFQDAQAWLREGIMDILFPMLYFRGDNFYPFVRDWQESSCGRHIVPGIGIYRLLPEYGGWSSDEIARQLNTSREAGTAGSILFRTHHLIGNAGGACSVYMAANRGPALVPPMEWAPGTAPAAPERLTALRNDSSLLLQWSAVPSCEGEPPVRYNVYGSLSDTVDIDNVDNLLASMLPTTSFEWLCRTQRPMSVAVTAVDAYGRESAPVALADGGDASLVWGFLSLPQLAAGGASVVVSDLYGRSVLECGYTRSVDVGVLQPGVYRADIVDSRGATLFSRWFRR